MCGRDFSCVIVPSSLRQILNGLFYIWVQGAQEPPPREKASQQGKIRARSHSQPNNQKKNHANERKIFCSENELLLSLLRRYPACPP